MPNIKLTVAYDGTDFFGFQRQSRHRSVQQVLEEAALKIFKEKIRIISASRTDTGVHADAHIVNFKTSACIPLRRIPFALNSVLPEDVRVLRASTASPVFHARFAAKGKRYEYTVFNGEILPPLLRRTVYRYPFPLDLAAMRAGVKLLTGRHDFRSFQGRANRQENTVRRIRKFSVLRKPGPFIHFLIEGDGFLSNMVRNLVGTLLLVGRNKLSLNDLRTILSARDRRLAGPTAPAVGLRLVKVFYQ